MQEPTTGNEADTLVADNSSTTNPAVTPADSQATTETGAENTPVQPASTESAQTNTQNADDENAALAKFAKGQGINDLSELSEREISLLKMARDNKSAYDKTKQNQPKLEETSTQLATLGDEATDVQKLAAKVANMEYKEKKNTRAAVAIAAGLTPLADMLERAELELDAFEKRAQSFVNEKVSSVKEAIAGAQDIIAERYSDDAKEREYWRGQLHDYSSFEIKASKSLNADGLYAKLAGKSERIASIPSH